jgi:hypothetical protein
MDTARRRHARVDTDVDDAFNVARRFAHLGKP